MTPEQPSSNSADPAVGALSSAQPLTLRPLTLRAMAWRRYRQHVPAMISSVVLLLLLLAAIFSAQITGGCDPYASNLQNFRAAPSAEFPLGTDTLGARCLLSPRLRQPRLALRGAGGRLDLPGDWHRAGAGGRLPGRYRRLHDHAPLRHYSLLPAADANYRNCQRHRPQASTT